MDSDEIPRDNIISPVTFRAAGYGGQKGGSEMSWECRIARAAAAAREDRGTVNTRVPYK